MKTQGGHFVFLNTSMSTEYSILNISALGLLVQSVSFCTDFTIHNLSSLLFTSVLFQIRLEKFFPVELKGVNKQ